MLHSVTWTLCFYREQALKEKDTVIPGWFFFSVEPGYFQPGLRNDLQISPY